MSAGSREGVDAAQPLRRRAVVQQQPFPNLDVLLEGDEVHAASLTDVAWSIPTVVNFDVTVDWQPNGETAPAIRRTLQLDPPT